MTTAIPAAVTAYLARERLDAASVVALTGDASDRRYFRVVRPDGGTLVLALYAAPFDARTLPFLNVAALFAAMPVPVPRVLGVAGDLGVVVLDDLGDVTLQARVGSESPAAHLRLYRRAVELIHAIQCRGRDLANATSFPYGLAFDVEKLMWEMDFFITHFLEAYRGASIDPAARARLSRALLDITTELSAEPRVLCHRDYHSRNLMVRGDDLAIIDFQDARMGPDTYDLVSLLRDAYVDVPAPMVDALLADFLSRAGRVDEAAEFRRRFDLMSVQRHLKALGTFGYQATARQNRAYVPYIQRTLAYVRENLWKYARFGPLRDALGTYVEEIRA